MRVEVRMALSRAPCLTFGSSDENLRGFAGLAFVRRLARFSGLVATLACRVQVKRRRRVLPCPMSHSRTSICALA